MTKYPDDPFSNSVRKRLLWSELLQFTHELSVKTLTFAEKVSGETLSERIKELEEYESEHGFVYFGEKHWLNAVKAGLDLSYSDWVEGFLLEQKRVCWQDPKVSLSQDPAEVVKGNEGKLEGMIVEALVPPLFPENGQRLSQYNEGMSFRVGHKTRLVQAFHIVHNFPYYAEKAIEFLLWRGDSLDDNTYSDLWGRFWVSNRIDSRYWGTHLGECGVQFLEHDVCVALACENWHSDAAERLAEKTDNVATHRRKNKIPFWM